MSTPVPPEDSPLDDADLESVRDAFVDAFNSRDLDGVLDLLQDDAELADQDAEGVDAVADAFATLWERTPGVLLTAASLQGQPGAVAWIRADDEWIRASFIALDGDGGRLGLVEFVDDPAAVEAAISDAPDPDEVDEELDWAVTAEGEDPADSAGAAGPLSSVYDW